MFSTRRAATGNIEASQTLAFGKEAGVYAFSKLTADVPLPLPSCIGHLGLSVNISGYGPTPDSPFIQTTPPA